jgi:quercetin dioxygenase-like cupin family protein
MTNGILKVTGALGCLAAIAIAGLATERLGAQEHPANAFAGNKVIPLVRMDLGGDPDRQVIANLYEVPAGAMVPRHFHHGDEFHFVLSGDWAAEVEGRPTHKMKAGDAQYVEREKWHGGRVVSSEAMRLLGVMIVEKDKPIIETVR